MQEAMAAAVEGGTQLAICYLDLDGFKPVNDHYGRGIGDQILIAVADRLREQVRESDTVARLGGDEFVLLMGGFDSLIECANALDRLVKTLAQPHLIEGEELRVTASVGAILYPRDSHDADTLLRHADHAMYQAKQRGRNRVRFFDTVRDRRAHARRSQLERIGEAIEDGELRLYYQPKVDMRRGKVVGAEGLVRWQHPTKGLLPPGAFIPLLDGTELQQRLDWWVIGAGLEQLEIWHTQGLDLGLSLNISARSVQHEGFVAELRSRLEQHRGLTPHALSLEILESEALGDLDAVANVMERCEDLGVRFALDDFGTGYSSLTYFRRLPAQVLKIDQTFVRDLDTNSDHQALTRTMLTLASGLSMTAIAEGVETTDELAELRRMGCGYAQGYLFSYPVPAEVLALLIDDCLLDVPPVGVG
jgi:diguanylate cyclase (GGDEF)-like protein